MKGVKYGKTRSFDRKVRNTVCGKVRNMAFKFNNKISIKIANY